MTVLIKSCIFLSTLKANKEEVWCGVRLRFDGRIACTFFNQFSFFLTSELVVEQKETCEKL